jgi:hypothetical protein
MGRRYIAKRGSGTGDWNWTGLALEAAVRGRGALERSAVASFAKRR